MSLAVTNAKINGTLCKQLTKDDVTIDTDGSGNLIVKSEEQH